MKTKEELKELLKSYGITNDEELRKALKRTILDVGAFTTPLNCTSSTNKTILQVESKQMYCNGK